MQPVTVALIDPNKLFREGLKALLRGGDFQIEGEAASIDEALAPLSANPPQLILVDPASMGDVSDSIGRLRAMLAQTRIVVLTTVLEPQNLAAAIQAGADGFLMKDVSPDALQQSLRLVMLGEKVFPTHLAALLVSGRVQGGELAVPASRKGLSPREVEILRCLVNGDSNKMIANRLGITEATVKVHLKSLLRKISASNRTQAAIWALNNGLAEENAALVAAG
ncbi:LuxR C-terminal-related transcriptional regulator [Arenibaculum pallidiluteum]|uniref:LuxR C-terminal-related transcriptional regulator n=1 Tax=Arenibaculum pallidiluteum TaxID=2812559 RepID=UPI001A968F1D|nr:response regulator transcription factor [Arenibaculum pallidiluteum]